MTKVKCNTPQYSNVGAAIIRISGGMKSITPHYYGGEIVSLEISNKIISLGEILNFQRFSNIRSHVF